MSVFEIVRIDAAAWTDLGPDPARLYAGEADILYAPSDCAPADVSASKILGRRCFGNVQTSQRIWARSRSATHDHHVFVLGQEAILPGEKLPLNSNDRHLISRDEILSAIFRRRPRLHVDRGASE
jgi:hypothetical protein